MEPSGRHKGALGQMKTWLFDQLFPLLQNIPANSLDNVSYLALFEEIALISKILQFKEFVCLPKLKLMLSW
jgi:hypothetical protein